MTPRDMGTIGLAAAAVILVVVTLGLIGLFLLRSDLSKVDRDVRMILNQ